MNNPIFLNNLKKKLMNSEQSDFFAIFFTFNGLILMNNPKF